MSNTSTLRPWRTTLTTGVAIAAINLALLGAGLVLGADLRVAQSPAGSATEVGVESVLLMSVAPTILGGSVLWLAARRGVRAWRAVGWIGLALGLLTVPMPFTVVASAGTSVTLASMHVATGLAWLLTVNHVALRQSAASRDAVVA